MFTNAKKAMSTHRLKNALGTLFGIFILGLGTALAQNQTTQVVLGTGSSPAILSDSSGNIYFSSGLRLYRYNQTTAKRDTLYTHLSVNNYAIAGLAMGYADTVIYYACNDTICAFNLLTRKKRNVWKGFQYPTNIAFRPADGFIYAMEVGLDNGREPTLGKINPATGVRTLVAGDPRVNSGGGNNYINDTASKARFNFPRPNGNFRNRGALAFDNTGDTLYVGDPGNRTIRWVNVNNQVVGTYAGPMPGVALSPNYRDSIRHEARFFDIMGIAVDKKGYLYIADDGPSQKSPTFGNRIRKIKPGSGDVYTLAGNGQGLGTGTNNNQDYIAGIGTGAQIGEPTGIGFNKGTDTLYVSQGQRHIKLTKRIPTLAVSPLTDRLVGSGDNILVRTASGTLTSSLSLLSSPANVTLSGDTLRVPPNAGTGIVELVIQTPGDEDGWYPVTDTVTINIKSAQALTLKKIRDYRFGEAPFGVADSTSNNITGRPSYIRVVSMSPANTVTFDTTTQTFTINSAGSVIYRAIAPGDANFSGVIIQDTFQVLKANQQIIWTPIADKTFGDTPFVLTGTVNSQVTNLPSGQTLTYTVSAPPTVATYAAATQTITIVGAGTVIVRVNAAGNTNYNPATVLIDTFLIARRGQVLSVDSIPDLFIGSGFYNLTAATAAPSSGVALQYSLTTAPTNVTYVGSPARINVPASADTGWAVLRVIQPGNNNHLADTVYRRFRILRLVGLQNSIAYQALTVWPNPATTQVIVRFDNQVAQELSFRLINSAGQSVLINPTKVTDNEYLINLADLPKGIYTLIATGLNSQYRARIAKQ